MTVDVSTDNAYTPHMSSNNNNNVKDSNKEAYGNLTKNLGELVEHEYEESSPPRDPLAECSTINLHEFDKESESGSTIKGVFTLELSGKGPSRAGLGGGGKLWVEICRWARVRTMMIQCWGICIKKRQLSWVWVVREMETTQSLVGKRRF
mmetsp:Transcript_12865/g.23181  ORF Transcript_12865/g.23181 Transcript_12865/m.23181 type:complete len:150 (-) Transcript_12865:688-1137(-)